MKISSEVAQTNARADKNADSAAGPLFFATRELFDVDKRSEKSVLSRDCRKGDFGIHARKGAQADSAINLALNVTLEATLTPTSATDNPLPRCCQDRSSASSLRLHNGTKFPLLLAETSVGWSGASHRYDDYWGTRIVQPGDVGLCDDSEQVPLDVRQSRPYWRRVRTPKSKVSTFSITRVCHETVCTFAT